VAGGAAVRVMLHLLKTGVKPLAELRTIGATTWAEYKNTIRKDSCPNSPLSKCLK